MGLSANQVSLEISGTPLLQDISLEIEAGQITTVLGPNGAGKTSLLRLLVGELKPSSGSVHLQHRELKQWEAAQRARSMAVLPQHSVLNFPFSAEEVVMLGRIPHDTGMVRDREIVRAALQMVDGDYLAEREYTRLSGGERQRVHLARVLAQIWEPCDGRQRFLILDEPTASFDLAHQQLTMDIVRKLAGQDVGVMMVLHDLNLAARCSDQMVLLQCGRLVTCGAPGQVLTRENIRTVFQVEAEIGVHPVSATPLVIT